MRLSLLSPLLVILIATNSAFANREEPIISPQTGGQPFLLVFKDASKKSKRDPGIYVRDQGSGDWKLLFPGTVLLDNQRGASVTMLKLQEVDNRLPTMGVVDGRLRIWTLLSNPDDKTTFLTLGEEPVIELGSGSRWELPEITSADQVSVAQFLTPDRKAVLILISIKNPAPSQIAQSDGLTIAVTLETGDGARLTQRKNRALVIDRKFRQPSQLNEMARIEEASGLTVLSDSLEQATLNQWEMMDFGDYNAKAHDFVKSKRAGLPYNATYYKPTVAAWSADKQQAFYEDLVTFDMNTQAGAYLKQRWNLTGGNPVLTISDPANSNRPLLQVSGRMRLDDGGNPWFVNDIYSSDSTVFAVEQDFYFSYRTKSRLQFGKFQPNLNVPDRSTVIAYEKNDKVYAVISFGFFREGVISAAARLPDDITKGRTDLYVFSPQPSGEMLLERTLKLSDTFYEASELNARLLANAEGKETLSMDIVTPAQGDESRYGQARKTTSPYLDVLRSTEEAKQFVYTVPTKAELLTNNLVYREFDFSGGTNPNGIYELNDQSEVVGFVGGGLLQREGSERFEVLGRTTPYVSDAFGSFTASAFLIDPTYREGKIGFQTYIDLKGSKDNVPWRARAVVAENAALYKDLVDIRLMNGTRKHGSAMWLLQFYPEAVRIGSFQIQKNGDKVETSAVKPSTMAYDGNPQKFMERLVYASDGEPYLIMTPEISPDSREFQVKNLRTGTTLFPKRQYGNDALTFDFNVNAGDMFQAFNENSALSWKVAPFQQVEEKRNGSVAALVKNQLFAKFTQYLSEAADPKQPKRRRILLVPDELKALAADFVRESYLIPSQKDAPKDSLFHRFNRKLGLYLLNKEQADPNAVFENFEMAAKKKDETSVIVAGLDQLIEIDRPVTNESDDFLLKIPESEQDEEGKAQVRFREVTPHIYYLMAAGGPVEYETFRKKIPPPRATTLLIGTRDELAQLQERAETEMAAGLDKAFEVVELPPPTLESKALILEEVMNRPAIKGLGFDYDASEISDAVGEDKDQQRRKLFEYAITRVDALAAERGKNGFSMFAKFEEMFSEGIISDPTVRNTRLINRAFLERLLQTQFNLALNVNDLPPEDHRQILSQPDAILRLHRAGLLGEFELKAEIIRLSLAQLNLDPSRNMASSWIFAGAPGTGKSRVWEALVKALKLKVSKPGQLKPGSNGFHLDTVNIRKGDPEAIKRVIQDLNEFVTSEKGSTGLIFIDDLSFADDALGQAIVQWVRGLQQAEGGVYRYTNAEGGTTSVSVRNLTLAIAMNFTDNKDTLSKYAGDDALVSKIVATGNRYGMDKSFVDRFGGVFNFDKFHESVKEPALNEAVLKAAQSKMRRMGQFVVADPALIREASRAFPDLGARPFLSKVTEAILSQPDQLQGSKSKVFAIIPKTEEERALAKEQAAAEPARPKTTDAWGEQSAEVKDWVAKNARVIEIDQSRTGALMLMRLMVPSFRSPIIESLVYAIQTDPRYTSDRLAQNYFLAPSLLAIDDYLYRAQTIPLKHLKLNAAQFGLKTPDDRAEFQKLLEEMSVGNSPFFVPFPETRERLSLWSELGVNGKSGSSQIESRKNVLRSYRVKIEALLETHLLRTLNIEDLRALDNPEDWLRSLPEKVPDHNDEIGQELNKLLFEFARDFQSPDLREAKENPTGLKVDPWVSTHFFMLAVDDAIARLPWTQLSEKMVVALSAATHDLVLGQSVGVQNWLFNPEDHVSLLKPVTTNLINEMIEFNSSVREVHPDFRRGKSVEFGTNCEKYLDPKGGM